MSLTDWHMLEVVKRIVSDDARVREGGADLSRDWISSLDKTQADLAARLLAIMASIETDNTTREAQLFAILELLDMHSVVAGTLSPLDRLDLTDLDRGQADYLVELRKYGSGQA